MTLDDQAALNRFAEGGDPAAFEVLAARYQSMVLATCRRTLGNDADAEDAAQETFLKLARSASSIRSNAASWLYSCAVGTSVDLLRRSETRRRAEQTRRTAGSAVETPTDGELLWSDLEPRLDRALADLSEPDRTVIVGRYLAGRSQADLAREAGVTDGTMHRRIRRALARLRMKLAAGGLAVMGPEALAGAFGQMPVAAPSGGLAAGVAKIGLLGLAGSSAAGGVGLKLGLVIAAVFASGGLLFFDLDWFAGPAPNAAALLAAEGEGFPQPRRVERMQMISGVYATFAEGGVQILDDEILINLRANSAGESATVRFIIDGYETFDDQNVLDTTVAEIDMLPGMATTFREGQEVPIAVEFDKFGRLSLKPLVANTKLGRNEPAWFGVRPPAGWEEHSEIPEDAGPLGILGPWATAARWPVRMTPDEIVFGARSWQAMRFQVVDWYEGEKFSEVKAIYLDGWNQGLIGNEFLMLIRKVPGGYTLAYYPEEADLKFDWPTSFVHSEDNPVQVFGFAYDD